jgi:hypothetical protein
MHYLMLAHHVPSVYIANPFIEKVRKEFLLTVVRTPLTYFFDQDAHNGVNLSYSYTNIDELHTGISTELRCRALQDCNARCTDDLGRIDDFILLTLLGTKDDIGKQHRELIIST